MRTSDILGRLFVADTSQQRRRIIGSSWKRIIEAARTELDQVTALRLKQHVHFARRAADAVLAGNHPAGQALAANLLDTILRCEFSTSDRKSITNQKNRIDVEDYLVRLALVLGGIWGAHGQYWSGATPVSGRASTCGMVVSVRRTSQRCRDGWYGVTDPAEHPLRPT
ncbi:MAG TPA: hypothetical protein VIJ07_09055 [Dermatophilaceae bacterium]